MWYLPDVGLQIRLSRHSQWLGTMGAANNIQGAPCWLSLLLRFRTWFILFSSKDLKRAENTQCSVWRARGTTLLDTVWRGQQNHWISKRTDYRATDMYWLGRDHCYYSACCRSVILSEPWAQRWGHISCIFRCARTQAKSSSRSF